MRKGTEQNEVVSEKTQRVEGQYLGYRSMWNRQWKHVADGHADGKQTRGPYPLAPQRGL